MTILKSTSGTARIIVILAVIAVALGAIIIVPKVRAGSEEKLQEADENYITTATREAKVEYMTNRSGFTAVFDSENKKFVEPDIAKKTVEPYGMSDENDGKYLLVQVSTEGEISVKWVTP